MLGVPEQGRRNRLRREAGVFAQISPSIAVFALAVCSDCWLRSTLKLLSGIVVHTFVGLQSGAWRFRVADCAVPCS